MNKNDTCVDCGAPVCDTDPFFCDTCSDTTPSYLDRLFSR